MEQTESAKIVEDIEGIRKRKELYIPYDLSRTPIYENTTNTTATTTEDETTRRSFWGWGNGGLTPEMQRSATLINDFDKRRTPSLSEHSNYKHSKWGEDEYDDMQVVVDDLDLSIFEVSGIFLVLSHWTNRLLSFVTSWLSIITTSRFYVIWQEGISLEMALSETLINLWTSLSIVPGEIKSIFSQPLSIVSNSVSKVAGFVDSRTRKDSLDHDDGTSLDGSNNVDSPNEKFENHPHQAKDEDEEPELHGFLFSIFILIRAFIFWTFPFVEQFARGGAKNI